MGIEEAILQHYKEEGKIEGKIEGKMEEKMEGIQKALGLGIPIPQICAIFGVTEEFVLEIQQNNASQNQ
jgi:predicted transposase YdaD